MIIPLQLHYLLHILPVNSLNLEVPLDVLGREGFEWAAMILFFTWSRLL